MRLEDLFLAEGKVRPIWRFFLSVALVYLAVAIAGLLGGPARFLFPNSDEWYAFVVLLELPALLGAYKVMTGLFERRPLGMVGLAFYPTWTRELWLGLGMGGLMMVAVGGVEACTGLARFSHNPFPATAEAAYGSGLFLVLAISATNEELIFRGYPFQKLVESVGPAAAVALSSASFGLAHLGNAHHTWISTLNTMLMGIPLSVAYLRTRSLWMPIGMHFSWNYLQGFVFGLPVSGYTFSPSLLTGQVHGAGWLTGSAYGPEGGLLCTMAVVGAGIFLLLSARIRISARMKELVFGPSPAAAHAAVCELPGQGSGEKGPI
jgi:hypothetical protein